MDVSILTTLLGITISMVDMRYGLAQLLHDSILGPPITPAVKAGLGSVTAV